VGPEFGTLAAASLGELGRDGWISTRTLVDATLGTIGPEEEEEEEEEED
jgi:hypothetical protein